MLRRNAFLCRLLLLACTRCPARWHDITPTQSFDHLKDVFFASPDTGLVTANIITTSSQSVIYRTTDGGMNWNYVLSPSSENAISELCRVAGGLWYALDGRDLIRSTDGGVNWGVVSQIAVSSPGFLYDLVFPTDSVGYAVYMNPMSCLKTTGAGNSWTQINFPIVDVTTVLTWGGIPSKLFTFLSADTGFVCSGSNYLQRTYDGGLSWDSVHVAGTHPNGGPYYIQFEGFGSQNAYAVTDIIFHTSDGGQSWGTLGVGLYADAFDFPDADTGYFATCDFIPNSTYTSWLRRIHGIGNSPVDIYPLAYDVCPRKLQFLNSRTGFAISECNALQPCYRLLRTDNGAVGREEPVEHLNGMEVFPQPAYHSFRIRLTPHEAPQEVVMHDMGGKPVLHAHLEGGKEPSISVAGLVPGLYMLSVRDRNGNSYHQKIMVD